MAAPPSKLTIRRIFETDITEQQRKDIVDMLTESFRQSMMLNSIISMKVDARDPFHRMCLLAGLDGGEVYVAETPSGEIVGAAIWVIPGRSFLDTKELQTKALVPLVEALEPADSEYWMSTYLPDYIKYTNECFSEIGISKEAMWNLITLGVLPEYQRRGVSKSLLEPVTQKAAQTGILRCLETDSETNVEIYTRMGYEVKGHYTFPKGDITIPMWVMLGK
ncbi:hypothetical protein BDV98DRAFT_596020 [Pterulicium gracile]|uniref:N-acetyltransferase domain-containing protein n=1 Tax=Pterulicium gracile TaxID=1884261 RepID=A0A5C3Q913_9AGAR|nr:hypothetical protein BDV98DRAFT_596020 [Pterula gracilis]